jgi:hypothetical protein
VDDAGTIVAVSPGLATITARHQTRLATADGHATPRQEVRFVDVEVLVAGQR